MPIGAKFWRWFSSTWKRVTPPVKAGLAALLVCAAYVYALLGPLVFDAAYWVFGKVVRLRSDRRLRVGASVSLVAVYLVALGALGSTAPAATSAGASSTLFVAANEATASASGTSASSFATAATTSVLSTSPATSSGSSGSAGPSAADADDQTSSSAGASFVPNATGILPPATGGAPSDRLPGEPDPALTPGALNPSVTQATITSTICVSGWTATIRPSSSYTTALKIQQIAKYSYSDTRTSSYEEDHLISLELGGAPADPRNLWPEPYTISLADGRSTGAYTKDGFETKLKNQVCAGTITLAQAQGEIGDHWVHAYYGVPFGASPTGQAPTAVPTIAVTAPPKTAPPATSVVTPPPVALGVTFVSLPNPAPLGGVAYLSAKTSPGATCSIVVIWPSGNKSGAGGLKTTPTARADGMVSWSWNVAATTIPGTAKATVTCTLNGGSAQGIAHFPVG